MGLALSRSFFCGTFESFSDKERNFPSPNISELGGGGGGVFNMALLLFLRLKAPPEQWRTDWFGKDTATF